MPTDIRNFFEGKSSLGVSSLEKPAQSIEVSEVLRLSLSIHIGIREPLHSFAFGFPSPLANSGPRYFHCQSATPLTYVNC